MYDCFHLSNQKPFSEKVSDYTVKNVCNITTPSGSQSKIKLKSIDNIFVVDNNKI